MLILYGPYGDIWTINIMTRREQEGSEGVGNVLLIDFDWAGLDGTVRYPPYQ